MLLQSIKGLDVWSHTKKGHLGTTFVSIFLQIIAANVVDLIVFNCSGVNLVTGELPCS